MPPPKKQKILCSWTAPEYPYHEKSLLWFLGALVAILGLVIYGLFTDGWTFSLAIVVCAGTYYLLHRERPASVTVAVSPLDIRIGHHIFPYNQLKGFWILYERSGVKRLYLRMEGKFKPDIFVDITDADPLEVSHALGAHLPEIKGIGEPLADTVVRFFRL